MKKKISFLQLKKRFIIISIIAFIVLLLLTEIKNDFNLMSFIQLNLHGVKTVAVVTDYKINQRKVRLNSSKSDMNISEINIVDGYYVKYKFELHTNMKTSESNKWVIIPESEWKHSSQTKQINVVYNRYNPELNSPEIVVKQYLLNLISNMILYIIGSVAFAFAIVFFMYTGLKKRGLYRTVGN